MAFSIQLKSDLVKFEVVANVINVYFSAEAENLRQEWLKIDEQTKPYFIHSRVTLPLNISIFHQISEHAKRADCKDGHVLIRFIGHLSPSLLAKYLNKFLENDRDKQFFQNDQQINDIVYQYSRYIVRNEGDSPVTNEEMEQYEAELVEAHETLEDELDSLLPSLGIDDLDLSDPNSRLSKGLSEYRKNLFFLEKTVSGQAQVILNNDNDQGIDMTLRQI